LHHHEAYNGAGYPSGLAEERIPLGARIFAVADTLDAMTSDRPYRRALPYTMALAEIKRCRGSQFDPAIVDVVLDLPVADLRACAAIPTTMAEEPPSQPSGKLRAGSLAS
jgi:HD-GYP domain-containing protein (c-di-GMP phosphodiesterase class II)